MSDKETIEVQRRRKGSTPEGKPRAQKPTRRPEGSPPSGGDQRPPSTGLPSGKTPAGKMRLPLWLVIPLVLLFIVFNLLSGGDSGSQVSEPRPQATPMEEVILPTSAPVEVALLPASEGQTWLVMLYQDADDQILEKDIYIDLNEAEKVGSSDRIHIVSQVDRYHAAYQGDANWTSTRRYYLTADGDLDRVNSHLVQDLGEVNMADGQTLVDFATWAIENFPADKVVLVLSDHGMGWPGGWSDPAPGGNDSNAAPLAKKIGDHLWLSEIDQALGEIRNQTGLDKFEIVGMDACLMAQLEVFSMLERHARYAIASEETEPALGWAYTSFLQALVSNPDLSGAELSRLVVDSYIKQDQRIVDPVAREEFLSQASPIAGLFGYGRASSEQLTQQLERNITLSAIDLGQILGLMDQVNRFSYHLQNEDQSVVATARNYARSYTSIFGNKVPPSFVDLGHFVQLVGRESKENVVKQSANELLGALGKTVIAERHGPDETGSTGISIYFPNATLYSSPMAGPQSYTTLADHFASQSLWDDFLAFHYHDISFDLQLVQPTIPGATVPLRAPGLGTIEVGPIDVSSSTAAPGQPVQMKVDISGQNIGYIYLFVGYYDPDSNSIFIADTDYLESPDTRELQGVYYPVWPETEAFTLDFTWDPFIFAISVGDRLIPAHFTPQAYGAAAADAVYTVEGTYTFGETGESRYARLYFRDGNLEQIFGYTSADETGAPREITPQTGDTFTVLDQWMDLDRNGKVTGVTPIAGESFTFGFEQIRWEEIYAAPGLYVVGFIIEDLDGNSYPVYTQVTVE